MAKTKKISNEKTTVSVKEAVNAYSLLMPTEEMRMPPFNITQLKKEDMFAVLYATEALKPHAEKFNGFMRDVRKRLEPENWKDVLERRERLDSLPEDEKEETVKAISEYNKAVDECIEDELGKNVELDSYRHISDDSFATLVNGNSHLGLAAVMLLRKILA